LSEIPEELEEGKRWKVKVDGEIVPNAEKVEISNEKYGILEYGLHPNNYGTWTFHENGGGGAATILYTIDPVSGKIYIGMIEASRPTLDEGKVWEIPRGFINLGETHKQAAERETEEEVGYSGESISLADEVNMNSAFFNTSIRGEGVSFFTMQVDFSDLVREHYTHPLDEMLTTGNLIFSNSVVESVKGNDEAEKIFGSKFFPITNIPDKRDGFTASALGYLWMFLEKQKCRCD